MHTYLSHSCNVFTLRFMTHRLEFDAYKADYEVQKSNASRDRQSAARFDDATRKFEAHKVKFEKLRDDVAIKLRFLDENKVSVTAYSHSVACKCVKSFFLISLTSPGESHAQAVASIPQRRVGLLFWQPECAGRSSQAVQYQVKAAKH